MAQSEYLWLERRLRAKPPEEHPPDQVEQVAHGAFIARFGRSRQADGICGSHRDQMTDSAPLIGTWKMVSRKREIIATGELIDALGPNPVGYINYGEDRRFYALVVSRDRPPPAALPLAAA